MLIRKVGVVIAIVLSWAAQAQAIQVRRVQWNLNDVTILYPLPSQMETSTSAMIPPNDALFRSKHLELGDTLLAALGSTGQTPLMDVYQTQQALRVVGVRIDPCFRDRPTDICKSQIRLSWQPIVRYAGKWTSLDVALHTFYTLSPGDWRLMIGEWDAIRSRYVGLTAGQPLQPHPALVREGLKGAFAQGLRSLLSKYATWDRIDRVTRITSSPKAPNSGGPGIIWDFAIARRDDRGGIVQVMVPNVASAIYGQPATFEIIANSSRDGRSFAPVVLSSTGNKPVMSTLEPGVENILPLLTEASNSIDPSNQQRLASLYRSTLRILQPSIHLPGTTDCVSCHMATSAQAWFTRNLPQDVRVSIERSVVKSWGVGRYPLTNLFPASTDTRSMRALGYLGSHPAISWRVIFESAKVADALNY